MTANKNKHLEHDTHILGVRDRMPGDRNTIKTLFCRSAAANAAGVCQACDTRGQVKSMHRLQTCRGAKREATPLLPLKCCRQVDADGLP